MALLVIEKQFLLKWLEKSKLLSRIYVGLAVLISFVIFNAADMGEVPVYIGGMFGAGAIPFVSDEFLYVLKDNAVVLVIALVGATPLVRNTVLKLRERLLPAK